MTENICQELSLWGFIMRNDIYGMFCRLDSITYNHSIRVMILAKEFEEFTGQKDDILSQAALMHDIGKVFIAEKILDKVDRLTNLEREMVSLHPYIGYQMLKDLDINDDICQIILYHHGKHPPTLKEIESVPTEEIYDRSLILHTIDAFEALTSDRPYHRGYDAMEAIDIMMREGNHHPAVMEYLIKTAEQTSVKVSAVHRSHYMQDSTLIDVMLTNWQKKNMLLYDSGTHGMVINYSYAHEEVV